MLTELGRLIVQFGPRGEEHMMSTDSATELRPDRFDVHSADGVPIAVWVQGAGPAPVMVHGSFADHTAFEPFVAVLRERVTTYCLDRRGFGASRDAAGYTIERDFDDVAAVVDVVAARTGGPVAVWGHSDGANGAMGGAARSANVSHLILYEPSLGLRYPPGSIAAIEAALDRGDHDAAIVAALVDILEMTDDEIDTLRASPTWPGWLAAAPTIPRECHAEQDWVYELGEFDRITAPTLMLTGTDTIPALAEATSRAAAAIPDANIHVLDGHGHFANNTDPKMVTTLVQQFIAS
jgi:pimeloyl-ACP methyl ester carboxylesterase